MKTAISRTWQRLKINIVLITLNNVEQNAKKKYFIYEMCLLFVIFRCPYTLSAAEQRVCFERRSTSKGKYQFFFIVLVKIFSADTFSKTVCSIYSFINSLDVLLLGVVKLASRKNWKDYGVLRTCIRELKVKRWRKSKESMSALFPTWCLLVC